MDYPLARTFLDSALALPTRPSINLGTVEIGLTDYRLFDGEDGNCPTPVEYPCTIYSLDIATLVGTATEISGASLLNPDLKKLNQSCPVVANSDFAYFHLDRYIEGSGSIRTWYRVNKAGTISATLSSSLQPADILIWGDKLIADETKL